MPSAPCQARCSATVVASAASLVGVPAAGWPTVAAGATVDCGADALRIGAAAVTPGQADEDTAQRQPRGRPAPGSR